MATAVDVSRATYPKTFHDGQQITPMEGRSLVPAFQGKPVDREAIYWEHEGNRAIRVAQWKLVAKGARGAWELYNIAEDRSEQRDLAADQPERVEKLAAMWQAWAQRAHVLPLNPTNPKNKKIKKSAFNHEQERFELKQDDDLDRFHAPYVQGRPFGVTATVTSTTNSADGVIVAQGGVTHGWSLYVADGEFCFATTHQGKRTVIRSGKMLDERAEVTVTLDKEGGVTFLVNGVTAKVAHVPGTLVQQPLDGLQVGKDMQGEVGLYAAPCEFVGRIESLVIDVEI
jgi:arylsulfatase